MLVSHNTDTPIYERWREHKDGDFIDHGEPTHNNQGEHADFHELIETVNEGESLASLMVKFPKTVSSFMPQACTKLFISNMKDTPDLANRKRKCDKC